MLRKWPLLLIITGLLLIVGGFVFDVLFAGIPYQDPTPEMSANYARNANIASIIRLVGLGVILLSIAAVIMRRLARRSAFARGS